MKRLISIDRLKPGMYVAEIKNISWIKHPFFRNQHLIKNEDEVQALRDCGGCEVYIDTEMGDDLDLEQNKPDDAENTRETENHAAESSQSEQPQPERPDQDAKTLEREAHSIKGAAANLGATATYEAALRLEQIG